MCGNWTAVGLVMQELVCRSGNVGIGLVEVWSTAGGTGLLQDKLVCCKINNS